MNRDMIQWEIICFNKSLCQRMPQQSETFLYIAPSCESDVYKEGHGGCIKNLVWEWQVYSPSW